MEDSEYLLDQLDAEPPAFMGLSLSELTGLVVRGFFCSVPVTTIACAFIFGHFMAALMGVVVSIGIGVAWASFRARKLRETSKGKPMGYSDHVFEIRKERWFSKYADDELRDRLYIPDGFWER